jgi:GST-like protein
MIDLYYWPTPNAHKITIFLEETGTPYRIVPVNIGTGEQFTPEFLALSPNNRMPAIVDHAPADDGRPLSVFESGAILMYLAEKIGAFLPATPRHKVEVSQWLFWQMGGLGPMAGQNHYFSHYAPEKIPYAIDRYVKETNRLYGVIDRRLADREFLAGDYSIADMAAYPWIVPYERQGQDLNDFPNLKRWFDSIQNRAAVLAPMRRVQRSIRTRPSMRIRPRYCSARLPRRRSRNNERAAPWDDPTIRPCRVDNRLNCYCSLNEKRYRAGAGTFFPFTVFGVNFQLGNTFLAAAAKP